MNYQGKPCSYVERETPCGRVRGLLKGDYCLFEGIRYATAERFEPPVVVTHWDGLYDATRFGPACIQRYTYHEPLYADASEFYYAQAAEKRVVCYSEDCLNLNIWAPVHAENAPVAVYIHGGSFTNGSNANTSIANGADYCARGIILISINYRLNAFGCAVDASHSGNQMLLDQIAALRWIRANIAAFGGDGQRVTVIGESAGALATQCLLYAEEARGLMQGVIMMSGGGNALPLPVPAPMAARYWQAVCAKLGAASLEELKNVPAQELFEAWAKVGEVSGKAFAHPVCGVELIPDTPEKLMAADQVTDVPVMLGLCAQDMWPYTLYKAILGWADYSVRHHRQPVYAYYFDRPAPGGDDVGAYHGLDLWYAFNTLSANWRPFEDVDFRLAQDMIDRFAAFIKTGEPNAGDLPRWEPLTETERRFLRFSAEPPQMIIPPEEELAAAIQNTERPFPALKQ